jgi:hypothetical protein
MAISIFLAKYFGLFFLIISTLFIVKPNQYKTMLSSFGESPALVMLSGVMALMLGLFLVLIHTIFASDWRLLITVICWLIFLKGWCLLACPKAITDYCKKKAARDPRVVFVVALYLVLALVLLYYGYCDQIGMMR